MAQKDPQSSPDDQEAKEDTTSAKEQPGTGYFPWQNGNTNGAPSGPQGPPTQTDVDLYGGIPTALKPGAYILKSFGEQLSEHEMSIDWYHWTSNVLSDWDRLVSEYETAAWDWYVAYAGDPYHEQALFICYREAETEAGAEGFVSQGTGFVSPQAGFRTSGKIFDVVLGPSTWEGMILMTPIFSALNQYNEVDGGFPEDFTMPDAETELVSKYSSGEKGWLTNRFGYDPQIWDSGATTLGEQAMFLIEGLIEQITTDEIANQVINNVVEYGNIKQDELTSIATEEQQPSTEVSDVGTAMRAATPHNTIQDIYTQKTEL